MTRLLSLLPLLVAGCGGEALPPSALGPSPQRVVSLPPPVQGTVAQSTSPSGTPAIASYQAFASALAEAPQNVDVLRRQPVSPSSVTVVNADRLAQDGRTVAEAAAVNSQAVAETQAAVAANTPLMQALETQEVSEADILAADVLDDGGVVVYVTRD